MRNPTVTSTVWAVGAALAAALAGNVAADPAVQSQSKPAVTSSTTIGTKQPDTDSARIAHAETADPAAPGRSFRDCAECPEMVQVPAGKFTMGWNGGDPDEKPEHEVTIPKPFAIGKFEVTFDEYAACVAGGGCVKQKNPYDSEWGKGRHPVIDVSWENAEDYVAWLSQKTGKRYRLLTEAEWEYAARAGTTTRYAFGDTITHDQANFSHGNQGQGKTVEVGSYPPNAWGLHDMHGNVWEWVEDCWDTSYEGAPSDGTARIFAGCPTRATRGGSWDYVADEIRASVRFALKPVYRTDEIGFRVARSLD